MLTLLLWAAIPSLSLLWWLSVSKEEKALSQTTFDEPVVCAMIIACTGYDCSGDRNIINNVQSRADPNQRLVRTFGIDNAFTTIDENYRKDFRSHAKEKITLDDGRWKTIADLARQLVGTAIPQSGSDIAKMRLDSLAQSVTLKISLHVLFDRNPFQLDDEVVLEIARTINFLWTESKSTIDPSGAVRERLRRALGLIFPGVGLNARQNPLNLILPAYETLWRVVLFCFIEVTFRHGARAEWKQVLNDFLADPTNARFEERGPRPGAVSVADIINETLRLYPPTKRVYRKFHIAGKTDPEMVAANIEACHRNPAIWGSNSWLFKPYRWRNIGNEARNAYMPFGGSTFVCPAKQDFGPRMIGIIVAALATHILECDWKLELCVGGPNGGEELSREEPLVSDRNNYEWIEISRKLP